MAKYDIETFLVALETHLKADLNTKIAEINTEKNDSITLLTIDSNAYCQQSMDQVIMNYDPYIYYGITDIRSIGLGPQTANTYRIVIAIIVADAEGDTLIARRLLRYQRALSEVIENKSSTFASYKKTNISSLVPIAFQIQDETRSYRAIGVELETTIA